MILFRNGYGLFDQELLAIKFGIKIKPDVAAAFSSAIQVVTSEDDHAGIPTIDMADTINHFFEELAPGLLTQSVKASAITSMATFLSDHLNQDHDIWVEYHAQEIHKTDRAKGNYIHDGLIESFDPDKNEVVIIDSLPEHKQRLLVSVPILERAISLEYGRETGFIIVKKHS
jgi:hypothetical protein